MTLRGHFSPFWAMLDPSSLFMILNVSATFRLQWTKIWLDMTIRGHLKPFWVTFDLASFLAIFHFWTTYWLKWTQIWLDVHFRGYLKWSWAMFDLPSLSKIFDFWIWDSNKVFCCLICCYCISLYVNQYEANDKIVIPYLFPGNQDTLFLRPTASCNTIASGRYISTSWTQVG